MDFNSHINDTVEGKKDNPIEVPTEGTDVNDNAQVKDVAESTKLHDVKQTKDVPTDTTDLNDLVRAKIGKQVSFKGRVDLGTIHTSRHGCGCNNACVNSCTSSCVAPHLSRP
jgi:hypothetical protein